MVEEVCFAGEMSDRCERVDGLLADALEVVDLIRRL